MVGDLSLSPIQPQEATRVSHLVPIVDGNSIMDGSVGEAVFPWGGGIIAERACILSHIQTFPPQIQVQLISVCRPGLIPGHPATCPGVAGIIMHDGLRVRVGVNPDLGLVLVMLNLYMF